MRKIIFVPLFIFTFSIKSFGTIQTSDLLIIGSDTILIAQFPLDQFYKKGYSHNPGFFSEFISTACWRGYKAVWVIKDNQFYLKAIYDCNFKESVPINRIGREPDKDGLVFADWFSGSFKINLKTKREISESWNFGHLFMRKKKIKIAEGRVINSLN